jgi:hypothetical protein
MLVDLLVRLVTADITVHAFLITGMCLRDMRTGERGVLWKSSSLFTEALVEDSFSAVFSLLRVSAKFCSLSLGR